jgi:hypothetical protein
MPDIKLEPNSHRSKRDIPQVTKGKVIDRKKSLGRKFAEAFIEDDMENIQDYILYEVAAPSIKKAIFDAIVGALQMILGVNSSGKSTSSSSTGHTSYRSFYASDRSKGTVSSAATKPKSRYELREIILETRGEAEAVLEMLNEALDTYQTVSVADLYSAVGITADWVDNKVGWTDLRTARIRKTIDGYVLDMPRPVSIE